MLDVNNLENGGERIEIRYESMNWDHFNVYQKSHFKRYEFAKSLVSPTDVVADMACGSGYGSCILSEAANSVDGYDLDPFVVQTISDRYKANSKVNFTNLNLLELEVVGKYDKIISFETVEHLDLRLLPTLFRKYKTALKENGILIFSVPYMQSWSSDDNSHHRTFGINEDLLKSLLKHDFSIERIFYQNYQTHTIADSLDPKDFIICIARKLPVRRADLDTTVSFNIKSVCEGHHAVTYRGVPYLKCPFDYVIYQMIMNEVKPDLVIEIGTNEGGGALYIADLMDKIGHGEIHTIDLEFKAQSDLVKSHPRIKRFRGGYQEYDVSPVKAQYRKILVIDDGSHSYGDVLASLKKFGGLVSPGSYFIVEDGILDELGYQGYDGGPIRAIQEYLDLDDSYDLDRKWCDFFGKNATFNVVGYLRKKS